MLISLTIPKMDGDIFIYTIYRNLHKLIQHNHISNMASIATIIIAQKASGVRELSTSLLV